MTMRSLSVVFAVALAAAAVPGFGGAARGESQAVVELDAATARAQVAASEGLVLVDLYADW